MTPLVIFGFDAGDPDWLVRWANEGHLPALASVLQRGCWAKTAGPELISEHGVWVPMFSGVSRGQLGYYYFRQLKPGTYDLQPITGLDLKAPLFWSRLNASGNKIAVIDVPEVFPVPGLPGIQLANWAPHYGWATRHPAYLPWAEPQSLLGEVEKIFGPQLSIIELVPSTAEEDRQLRQQMLQRVEKKGALCRHLLAQDEYDLIVVVFTETHTAGHQFWKYRPEAPPSPRKTDSSDLTHATREVYQAVDRELGRLLAQLPQEANLIVVSSVGLEDYYPTGGLTEAFCRKLGYQASSGPAPFSLKPMALIRRAFPESWRVAVSRRLLSRDAREGLVADQFRLGTDWTRTTAFALPTFYAGLIRVNLRGREPQGIVAPGAEYAALLDRIEADLHQLVDPVTGGAAVKNVTRPGELFGETPPPVFPDLWVEWQPANYYRDRVIHPRAELTQQRPEFFRDSDHCRNGFVAAAGPAIKARGALADVDVLDLTPTFLSLLGQPVPSTLSGKVIGRMLHG